MGVRYMVPHIDTKRMREEGQNMSGLSCGQLCVQGADEIDMLRAALEEIKMHGGPAAVIAGLVLPKTQGELFGRPGFSMRCASTR
jgi:hypothetical protein